MQCPSTKFIQEVWPMGLKKEGRAEFPVGPVVKTRCFHCCGPDSIPGRGTKIPQAMGRQGWGLGGGRRAERHAFDFSFTGEGGEWGVDTALA